MVNIYNCIIQVCVLDLISETPAAVKCKVSSEVKLGESELQLLLLAALGFLFKSRFT